MCVCGGDGCESWCGSGGGVPGDLAKEAAKHE